MVRIPRQYQMSPRYVGRTRSSHRNATGGVTTCLSFVTPTPVHLSFLSVINLLPSLKGTVPDPSMSLRRNPKSPSTSFPWVGTL